MKSPRLANEKSEGLVIHNSWIPCRDLFGPLWSDRKESFLVRFIKKVYKVNIRRAFSPHTSPVVPGLKGSEKDIKAVLITAEAPPY